MDSVIGCCGVDTTVMSADDQERQYPLPKGEVRLPSESTTGTTMDSSANSTSTTLPDASTGEFAVLLGSVEDDSPALSIRVESILKRQLSHGQFEVHNLTADACYGHPLSAEEAQRQMPPGEGGLVWYATIIPEIVLENGKLKRGLNEKDFDIPKSRIKPRRKSLPVTAKDFFSSLTRIEGSQPGHARYIFHGVLNGWPSLRTLELLSLERRRNQSSVLPSARELLTGQILWMNTWSAEKEGEKGQDPKIHGQHIYRAKLRGPPWSGIGYASHSPGFCSWYEAQNDIPKFSFGTYMLQEIDSDPICTTVHMISHRYAVARESPKDRLTYHSVCLLEWDHGRYCTVAEAAYLNGIGGYKGRTNWFDDRDEPVTALYKLLPPEMVTPWKTTNAELRCYDVPARNLDEFKAYIQKYEGPTKRFVDPHYTFSHPVRLTFRTKRHLAQYFLNYIQRDTTYGELKRNCQTFVADLCCFLAGKRDIEPFHPVNRIDYNNRTHFFLYDPHMYTKR